MANNPEVRHPMFGVVQDMPAVTEVEYHLVEKHLGPDRPPGLISHVSGPTENGWRVVNVWDSEDDFRRFQSQRLLRAAGLAAQEGLDASKAAHFTALTVTGAELPFR
jgi:heme-degrading monooxygenase HmoA